MKSSPSEAPHRKDDFNGYFHSNWPDDWLETYAAEGFFAHDPIPLAASLNILPVRWSDLLAGRAGFVPSAAQARVLEVGAAHGYRDGVCVPVHGPGAYLAIGSYAGAAPDTSDEVLLELHLLTLHADARLSALGARRHGGGGTPRSARARSRRSTAFWRA
jgi:LuxR family transcriptional regulator, quorum-sensing system regulator BjaR1